MCCLPLVGESQRWRSYSLLFESYMAILPEAKPIANRFPLQLYLKQVGFYSVKGSSVLNFPSV